MGEEKAERKMGEGVKVRKEQKEMGEDVRVRKKQNWT